MKNIYLNINIVILSLLLLLSSCTFHKRNSLNSELIQIRWKSLEVHLRDSEKFIHNRPYERFVIEIVNNTADIDTFYIENQGAFIFIYNNDSLLLPKTRGNSYVKLNAHETKLIHFVGLDFFLPESKVTYYNKMIDIGRNAELLYKNGDTIYEVDKLFDQIVFIED
ncbi:hypothetical protein [Crocinitomix catalasitica]|uniref:hypothetical protein n=1 Tax=Crocinitomix catalasitica TaxID=184607 RepID=UPI0004827200|nr:hypothetical protein [Crocinitomix catalasitica]